AHNVVCRSLGCGLHPRREGQARAYVLRAIRLSPSCADSFAVYCRAMAIGGVLFDIDGVLVTSWKPIEGASKTLRTLSDPPFACSYLPNTTTRTRVQIAELLTEAGMAVRADEVIPAAVLTAEYVCNRYPDARCFLVNSGQIAEDMPGIDIVYSSEFTGPKAPATPDVVLLGGA